MLGRKARSWKNRLGKGKGSEGVIIGAKAQMMKHLKQKERQRRKKSRIQKKSRENNFKLSNIYFQHNFVLIISEIALNSIIYLKLF